MLPYISPPPNGQERNKMKITLPSFRPGTKYPPKPTTPTFRPTNKTSVNENSKPALSNAPEAVNMNTWMSVMGNNGGLTKTNKYLVRINPPARLGSNFGGELTYMCTGAQIPNRTFNTLDYRYYGPTKKMPVQAEFNNITFQFLLRERMQERIFFEEWMELIQPHYPQQHLYVFSP